MRGAVQSLVTFGTKFTQEMESDHVEMPRPRRAAAPGLVAAAAGGAAGGGEDHPWHDLEDGEEDESSSERLDEDDSLYEQEEGEKEEDEEVASDDCDWRPGSRKRAGAAHPRLGLLGRPHRQAKQPKALESRRLARPLMASWEEDPSFVPTPADVVETYRGLSQVRWGCRGWDQAQM